MNVSASVMTHPTRLAAARRVCQTLAPIHAEPAVDPEPAGKPGAMRSARLAWAAADPHATHHLVLQDDVEVADGFADAVAVAVRQHPAAAIGFFAEWGSRTAALVRWAVLAGASWVPMINPYVPTQALVLPSPLALDLAAFLRDETADDEPDDEAILRFLERRGTTMLVSAPNLVEHLDLPSLTGNEGHGVRRATCLPAGPAPALTATVLDLPARLPFLAWVDAKATTVDTADFSRRPTLETLPDPEAALAPFDAPEALRNDIGAGHLAELWVAAVATGMLAPRGDLDDPVVRNALRTMAPGALRTHVAFDVLDRHADELAALVEAGVRHGYGLRPR